MFMFLLPALAAPVCGSPENPALGGIAVMLDGATLAWPGTDLSCDEAVCEFSVPAGVLGFSTTGSVDIALSCNSTDTAQVSCSSGRCVTTAWTYADATMGEPALGTARWTEAPSASAVLGEVRAQVERADRVLATCDQLVCDVDSDGWRATLSELGSTVAVTTITPSWQGWTAKLSGNTLAAELSCFVLDGSEGCGLTVTRGGQTLTVHQAWPQAWTDADPTWMDEVRINNVRIGVGGGPGMAALVRN